LYYEWFPNPALGKEEEKKLLGLTAENQNTNIIAVSCKCYCLIKADGKTVAMFKGINVNLNRFTEECRNAALKKTLWKWKLKLALRQLKSTAQIELTNL
jgi:hypothetical protein